MMYKKSKFDNINRPLFLNYKNMKIQIYNSIPISNICYSTVDMKYTKINQPFKRKSFQAYQDENGDNWFTAAQMKNAMLICNEHLDKSLVSSKIVCYDKEQGRTLKLFMEPDFQSSYQDRHREYMLKRQLRKELTC